MGGLSGPMLLCQVAAAGAESIGPKGPPTTATSTGPEGPPATAAGPTAVTDPAQDSSRPP
ncbi:DUF6053 domain-containing protein [Lysobacter enzymogenes]|uniref:DUF6053 domain-containing protein n=1 Tax=Lysobacter enzymogenes TaxID=69 RepID=UPI0037487CDD